MSATDLTHTQHRQAFQSRARALADKLDEIAELQEDVKTLKAEAKADGYDMKALGQVIREMRRGAEYQAAQLSLELVVDTYRDALSLPRDLETAQAAVRDGAKDLPETDDTEETDR